MAFAAEQICLSKTFDNGTICASEQAIVVERPLADKVIEQFKRRGGYFLSEAEVPKLEAVAFDPARGGMNPAIVGQSAARIAEMAGIDAPKDVQVLLATLTKVGDDEPLSSEMLAPILAFYVVENFEEAVNLCIDLNFHGGIGHTASIFSNDREKVKTFAVMMNAGGRAGCIAERVASVNCVGPAGRRVERPGAEIVWAYRATSLRGCVVLSVELERERSRSELVVRRTRVALEAKLAAAAANLARSTPL